VAVFPIYWVPQRVGRLLDLLPLIPIIFVSNLLGSPASGEEKLQETVGRISVNKVSNLLGSPASGETP
jgi:hypothetical protein